jgi:cell division protein FtsQ
MSHADALAHPDKAAGGLYRITLALFLGLVALLLLLFGTDWILRADSFPARHVRFEGEFRHVVQPELELAVKESVRGNFLLLDLDAVKAQVETLPWVYSASVRRYWPRDVYVRFTEQQIVARWGEREWVNHVGEAVKVDGVEVAGGWPRLEGPVGTSRLVFERYLSLERMLAGAGLSIKRLTLTPRRTWRIELTNNLVLVLDREDLERKVERLTQVYHRTIAPQVQSIRQIDLRYTNGFAIEWRNRIGSGGTSSTASEGGT